MPPIHVATTYLRDEDNGYSSGYVYGRPDNATVREAEGVIAMLEEAPAGALLFSLRHGGGDRRVPGARAGRPRRRAPR